jgi:environmental stress-induced protein Ves
MMCCSRRSRVADPAWRPSAARGRAWTKIAKTTPCKVNAVQIIRANDGKIIPWKNGGGSTTEIAVGPAGASLEAFDWRVSMARVASDGPFSDFPGIDRTLAVVKGDGLVLTIGDDAPVTLSSDADPVSFPGDTPTSARLTAGEITDLNVMTRRGHFRHRLLRITTSVSYEFAEDDIAIVLSLDGMATVNCGRDSATLAHGDAALVSRAVNTGFQILPAAKSCYLVWLREQRVPGA